MLAAGVAAARGRRRRRSPGSRGSAPGTLGSARAPDPRHALRRRRRLAQKLMNRDGRTMVCTQRALRPAGLLCDSDLTTKRGPAPTARLQRALDTFGQACTHLAALPQLRSRSAITERQAREDGRGAAGREARRRPCCCGRIRCSRPARFARCRSSPARPRKAGSSRASDGSRARSRANRSRFAAGRAPIGSDLMREEGAYTQGRLRADTLGFAGIGADRINLAPSVCDGLVQLAYRTRSADRRGRAARARRRSRHADA